MAMNISMECNREQGFVHRIYSSQGDYNCEAHLAEMVETFGPPTELLERERKTRS